jgi:hypothetical protein
VGVPTTLVAVVESTGVAQGVMVAELVTGVTVGGSSAPWPPEPWSSETVGVDMVGAVGVVGEEVVEVEETVGVEVVAVDPVPTGVPEVIGVLPAPGASSAPWPPEPWSSTTVGEAAGTVVLTLPGVVVVAGAAGVAGVPTVVGVPGTLHTVGVTPGRSSAPWPPEPWSSTTVGVPVATAVVDVAGVVLVEGLLLGVAGRGVLPEPELEPELEPDEPLPELLEPGPEFSEPPPLPLLPEPDFCRLRRSPDALPGPVLVVLWVVDGAAIAPPRSSTPSASEMLLLTITAPIVNAVATNLSCRICTCVC